MLVCQKYITIIFIIMNCYQIRQQLHPANHLRHSLIQHQSLPAAHVVSSHS